MAITDLVWLEQAQDDLNAIFDHIAVDNPRAAEDYIETIVAACDRLRDFPRSGRAFDARYRLLVVRNHLIFYRKGRSETEIVVAAVIDGRRDMEPLVRTLDEGAP